MPIKKIIDIEVSDRKLENARRALVHIDTLGKSLLKNNKAILEMLSKMPSLRKASAKSAEDEAKSVEKQRKQEEAIARIRKQRSDYEKSKAKQDLQTQLEKRKLEKPEIPVTMKIERYKGLGGIVRKAADEYEEKAQAELEKADFEIKGKQEERKDLESAWKQAQEKQAEIETKGVYSEKKKAFVPATAKQKEKAQADVESALSALKGKDEEIRQAELAKSAKIGEKETQSLKFKEMEKAANRVGKALSKMGNAILSLVTKPLKQLKDETIALVMSMLKLETGIASFNTATSLITNREAREQQMKYGLSTSQNYAFSQAKTLLNIQSDEDLMYMNRDQRDRFLQYMEKYSAWYEKMDSSGVLQNVQEMQLEFKELKQELAMEFLQWVAENKDTIMACIKGIFEFIKTVANIVMSILTFFTGKKQDLYDSATSSDTINNNANNTKITNVTINANTTNNATGVLGSQEALSKFAEENWSNLAKQVVGAIGG